MGSGMIPWVTLTSPVLSQKQLGELGGGRVNSDLAKELRTQKGL